MDMGKFIAECYELGIRLLNKETLTKEEEQFLRILDEFEKWVEDNGLAYDEH